jgi:hypothetical protein
MLNVVLSCFSDKGVVDHADWWNSGASHILTSSTAATKHTSDPSHRSKFVDQDGRTDRLIYMLKPTVRAVSD